MKRAPVWLLLLATFASLLGLVLPLLCAVFLALTAEEYTYSLQDLPTWLTNSYGSRQDVMAPLSAYMQSAGTSIVDWVRVFVRLFVLLFVNLFEDPQRMSAAIDRIAPLCMLLYPAAYMIGYLRGPALSAKKSSMNRRAKKAAVRKAGRSHLAEELVGGGGEVHYGHQADEEKKKRRELV